MQNQTIILSLVFRSPPWNGIVNYDTSLIIFMPLWSVVAINPLAAGKCSNNFKSINLKLIVLNISLSTCSENALRKMPQDLTNEQSILVQVMAWCHQAPSHYMSKCWLRSMRPYAVTRQQRVNSLAYCQQYDLYDWNLTTVVTTHPCVSRCLRVNHQSNGLVHQVISRILYWQRHR